MKLSLRTEWPHWLLIAGMGILAAVTWSDAPDRIPVHWNAGGDVDGWGGRFEGLLLLPLMTLFIYVALTLVPRIDPARANYEKFRGAYSTVRLGLVLIMAGIYGVTHLLIRGFDVRMNTVVMLSVGLLMMLIGNVMGKIRPNWFIGIRTPWTLSSKRAWSRTHRLGGWVFIGIGLLFVAGGFVDRPWAFWMAMAGTMAGTFGLVAYSFFAWRDDPDRSPPGSLPT